MSAGLASAELRVSAVGFSVDVVTSPTYRQQAGSIRISVL